MLFRSRYIKDPNCKNDNWPVPVLDALAVSLVRQILKSVVKALPQAAEDRFFVRRREEEKGIAARLEAIERQNGRLLDLYQTGSLPAQDLTERMQALARERAVLAGRLESTKALLQREKQSLTAASQNLWEHFDRSDLEAKRLLIHSLIESIVIDGKSLWVHWRV